MGWTRITTEEAAKQLGISQQALRVQMKKKVLPIGMVFCGSDKPQKQTYIIYQELIDSFLQKGEAN